MWELVKNANGREREQKLLAYLVSYLLDMFQDLFQATLNVLTMLKFMTFTLFGGLSTLKDPKFMFIHSVLHNLLCPN